RDGDRCPRKVVPLSRFDEHCAADSGWVVQQRERTFDAAQLRNDFYTSERMECRERAFSQRDVRDCLLDGHAQHGEHWQPSMAPEGNRCLSLQFDARLDELAGEVERNRDGWRAVG